MYVLRIPYADVKKDIKWEDPNATVCGNRPGEGLFPHLYNGLRLGKDEVDSVACWDRGDGAVADDKKGWEQLVKDAEKEGWLVY